VFIDVTVALYSGTQAEEQGYLGHCWCKGREEEKAEPSVALNTLLGNNTWHSHSQVKPSINGKGV
jgi:alpha-D-ribose 1-methylphosphonate 5-triphosphate synthase subunit PhnG